MVVPIYAPPTVEGVFYITVNTFFFLSNTLNCIYLFIYGCIGSSLLRAGFLQLQRAGLLFAGARASHCGGFFCCGAQAIDTWVQQLWLASSRARAQQLWRMGLVAPRHVGSSRTRARTHVPCIVRQILNHCATREVPLSILNFTQVYVFCLTPGCKW